MLSNLNPAEVPGLIFRGVLAYYTARYLIQTCYSILIAIIAHYAGPRRDK